LALCSLLLPPGNKESLGQITPLHVVILGPIFPYIWCLDSDGGSPQSWWDPHSDLPHNHPEDMTGQDSSSQSPSLASNTGHSLVSPPTLLGLPLQSLPLVSLGFRTLPMLWAISGQLRW
jgi:hypothetical protein